MIWIFALSVWTQLRRFGGPGLVVLGLIDASPVPVPGSIDALTVVLAASNRERWFYYAMMAVVGSEIGGTITYWLAKKAGEEEMQKRIGRQRAERLHGLIEKWGFGAVAVPAMLPPPFPLAPFLVFSGATQYPLPKYLAALATGRMVKYTLLAFLASRYGRRVFARIGPYQPILIAVVIVGLVGIALLAYWGYRRIPNSGKPAGAAAHSVKPGHGKKRAA